MIALKFAKEIKGVTSFEGYKDWIAIDNLQFGVGRSVPSSSKGTATRKPSDPSFSEIMLEKTLDMASTSLFIKAAGGQSLGDATICFIRSGTDSGAKPEEFVKIILTDAIISSYSTSAAGSSAKEQFSLNFTKITYVYNEFDGKTIKTGTPQGWNLASGKEES